MARYKRRSTRPFLILGLHAVVCMSCIGGAVCRRRGALTLLGVVSVWVHVSHVVPILLGKVSLLGRGSAAPLRILIEPESVCSRPDTLGG